MKPIREILLVDMDAFFASVEIAQRPHLRGKQVIVGGSVGERGVVSAASYEAKALGVRGGMPLAEAQRRCPNAVFIRADFEKYVYVAGKLVELFEKYSPVVESASIDEAYLDITGMSGLFGSAISLADELKKDIKSTFRITASIGIAPNKTWAKIACNMGKPDGLTILGAEQIPSVAEQLPVEKMPGVGVRSLKVMNRLGIRTIADLAKYPLRSLESYFGINATSLRMRANGEDPTPVVHWRRLPRPKSIAHESTFSEDVSGKEELRGVLAWLSERVAYRLRSHNAEAHTVQLKVRHADFRTFVRRQSGLNMTNAEHIFRALEPLFDFNVSETDSLRLLGVSLSSFTFADENLPQLPGLDSDVKREKAEKCIDEIKKRWGKGIIHWGRSAQWLAAKDDLSAE